METLGQLAYLTILGIVGFVIINGRSLLPGYMASERFARHGILHEAGAPDADAPDAFVARLRRRERIATWASAAAVVVGIGVLMADPDPIGPVLIGFAAAGRWLAMALTGAREAAAAAGGPRVSRGSVASLGDFVPGWPVAALVAAQLALTAVAFLILGATGPAWVLLAGLAVTGGFVALAAWVARQPQRAEDATTLAWAEAVRREDLVALVSFGPTLGAVLAVPVMQAGAGLAAWVYFGVVTALVVWSGTASARRTREVAGARR